MLPEGGWRFGGLPPSNGFVSYQDNQTLELAGIVWRPMQSDVVADELFTDVIFGRDLLIRVRCSKWLDSPAHRICRRVLATINMNQRGNIEDFGKELHLIGSPELGDDVMGVRSPRPHIEPKDRHRALKHRRRHLKCKCGAEYVIKVEKLIPVIVAKAQDRVRGATIDIGTDEF